MNKKLVLFGAGKIGRSFIGQLFSAGGFHVVFVDVYRPVINELNKRRNFRVFVKGETESEIIVENVSGIYAGDEDSVVQEICSADLLATAVGQNGLPDIFPSIAKGLLRRREKTPNLPLDIIIAENLRNAAEFFEMELKKFLPKEYPFSRLVGLVETSIGKMVPLMSKKDRESNLLQVFVESYNTLILDKKAFKNPVPKIMGLAPKENIKAWVDCKLFIHNLGHSAAAYLGFIYNLQFVYLHEALEIPQIFVEVKNVMQQSADALLKKYPDEFTDRFLMEHIDDLLHRFQNKALGDTIFRVGCDLPRKLGPNDRLAGAIKMAMEVKMPYEKILYVLVCGCKCRASDEDGKLFPADSEFELIYSQGIKKVLIDVCGFDQTKDSKLVEEAEKLDAKIVLNS